MIAGGIGQVLPDAQIPFRGQDRIMPERQLDLLERRTASMRQFCERAAQIVRGDLDPKLFSISFDNQVDGLRRQRFPDFPFLRDGPEQPAASIAATAVQRSTAALAQAGIGTLRTRLLFPWRSTITQRPSRC